MNKKELKEQNEWLKMMKSQQYMIISFLLLSRKDFKQLLYQEWKNAEQSKEAIELCKKLEQEIMSSLKKSLL